MLKIKWGNEIGLQTVLYWSSSPLIEYGIPCSTSFVYSLSSLKFQFICLCKEASPSKLHKWTSHLKHMPIMCHWRLQFSLSLSIPLLTLIPQQSHVFIFIFLRMNAYCGRGTLEATELRIQLFLVKGYQTLSVGHWLILKFAWSDVSEYSGKWWELHMLCRNAAISYNSEVMLYVGLIDVICWPYSVYLLYSAAWPGKLVVQFYEGYWWVTQWVGWNVVMENQHRACFNEHEYHNS